MVAMLELLPLSPTWVLVGVCLVLYYLYLTWPFYTFKRLGIPGPKPVVNFGNILSYTEGSHVFDCKCYKQYGKVFGFFEGRTPMLMIGDLEIIKEITVKQFNNFSNRRDLGSLLEAFAGGLFVIEDTDWKRVRSAISPTFSSSKLKQMSALVEKCADGLVSSLTEKQEKRVCSTVVLSAFAMDVISSTAFGVEVDSLNNPDHPFATHAKAIFKINMLKGFFYVMRLSMKEIIGNSLAFWLAGYDTTANTIALTAYNLAFNQEAQDKVKEEIDRVVQARGQLDYEAVNEMRFLEMCVNETLRIYPGAKTEAGRLLQLRHRRSFRLPHGAYLRFGGKQLPWFSLPPHGAEGGMGGYGGGPSIAFRFDRVCKEDTEVKGLHIPAGTIINIPAYAIHHDPEIWPEPEKFRPERFSKEEQESRDPYSFMPFGSGPRNCVGMRLAMLEIKHALAKVLGKFRFVTCEKTEVPLRLENNNGNQVTGGVWLKVEARTHTPRVRMSSA
ncbi:cytochrome P450 3A8-like [Branchiostoma floridae x Branchiostoma japonicum]